MDPPGGRAAGLERALTLPSTSPAHAVARLRAACRTNEARPFLDRIVPRKPRCAGCRLIASHCMCALRSTLACRSAVCLVMAPFEPLKPSNTGWLVADVVADTSAFLWSRTTLDPALEALLADPRRQPYLVFPGEFVEADRIVRELPGIDAPQAKPPLFVVLDGTWSEARRMFRRSPWLNRFPVLSLDATHASRYRLRQADRDHHLCTSQVVAHCLAMAGDHRAAETLEATLDVFSERYLRANQSVPADPADEAHRRLLALSEPAA